jgi:integrase
MTTQMLTEKAIRNARVSRGQRKVLWDTAISNDASLPGSFGIKVYSSGVKSWVVMYRLVEETGKIKQQHRRIGSYPALSLAEARERAREILRSAGRGIDPIRLREEEQRAAANIKTVAEAVDSFIERYVRPNNRSSRDIEWIYRTYVVPKLGDLPLPSVTPNDIHSMLDERMDAGTPYMANRLLDNMRRFFSWCVERQWITDSPTKNISRPAEEVARDRVLTDYETKIVWDACDGLGWPFGPCYRMLLVTGQRRGEVARMKWCNIDMDERVWTLPREATKSNRQHDVPLSHTAIDILAALPRDGEYVFSTNGRTPVSGFSRAKTRCDGIIARSRHEWQRTEVMSEDAIPHWQVHDLRRTVASGMAEIGIAPHVIEKVLNHVTGQISGVAAVYNRHSYLREKSDALNAWARALEAIIDPSDTNVIEFNR